MNEYELLVGAKHKFPVDAWFAKLDYINVNHTYHRCKIVGCDFDKRFTIQIEDVNGMKHNQEERFWMVHTDLDKLKYNIEYETSPYIDDLPTPEYLDHKKMFMSCKNYALYRKCIRKNKPRFYVNLRNTVTEQTSFHEFNFRKNAFNFMLSEIEKIESCIKRGETPKYDRVYLWGTFGVDFECDYENDGTELGEIFTDMKSFYVGQGHTYKCLSKKSIQQRQNRKGSTLYH